MDEESETICETLLGGYSSFYDWFAETYEDGLAYWTVFFQPRIENIEVIQKF